MEQITEKLWNKNFSLMVIGQIMSLFGNMVVSTVLPFHILNISGSASLYGLAMGLPVASLIIMTPIGGIMADRFKKHRLMFWLDVSITAIIVGYMLISGLFTEVVPVVIVKLLAFNAIQAIYMATTASSISLLAPSDKLASGNAVIAVVNMLSMTGGMAIAGILYDRFGLFPILIGCAVCFISTAIVDLFIRIPFYKQETLGSSTQSVTQIVKSDLSQSIRFILKEKPIIFKCIIPAFLMELIFGSMITIGLPVLITVHLGMSMTHVGTALAIMMFGGVLGGIIAGILGVRLSIPKGFIFIIFSSIFSISIGLVLLFDIPAFVSYIVLVAAGAAFAFSAKILSIALMTFIQMETPTELIGKVLSVLMVLPFIGQSLGYPIQGMLFQQFTASPWIVIFGVVFFMIAVAMFAYNFFRKELP
ncbi:MAG: MFS transporter [Bacteroidales bacterium]|nr:MFS transporter [Bacteroidales bacterium]